MTSYDLIWHLILLLIEKDNNIKCQITERRLEITFARVYRNNTLVFLVKKRTKCSQST